MNATKKIELSIPERIAVKECMELLAAYIKCKEINKTDTVLYREFQSLINKTYEIDLNEL